MLRAQPAGQPAPIDLIDPKAPSVRPSAAPVSAPAGNEAAPATPPPPPPPPASESAPAPSSASGEGSWVFIEGRWVNVARPAAAAPGLAGEVVPGSGPRSEALVTQRVIRIPVQRLVSGDARYNIVLRPGDIVRVPPQPTGTIFIGGQIARAGSYNMLERLTLTNALTAAGGLTQTAVPERVDLRRMVSTDQVAIVRLNVRAIFEGTHPDIFLKPNDQIIIGTNFWATPLAIIRNGFRATYGFGFLVDRNFGSDIFGVPPEAFDQGRNRDGLINLF